MTELTGTSRTNGHWTRRKFLGGTLLLSVAAVAACSGGTAAPAATAPAAASTPAANTPAANAPAASSGGPSVKMTDANKFDPDTLTITKGATVTWTNASTMPHSVTDDPAKAANKADAQLPSGAAAWDSGILQPAGTFSHTFDVAGTYKYFCVPHESLGMVATITVQ
jgi:plastocyanin